MIISIITYGKHTAGLRESFSKSVCIIYGDYLWNYEESAMLYTGHLIINNSNGAVNKIVVKDESGKVVASIGRNKKFNFIDKELFKLKLIKNVGYTYPLTNNGIYIGSFYIEFTNKDFYMYLFEFSAYLIVAFLFNQTLRLIVTKKKLKSSNKSLKDMNKTLEDTNEELQNLLENLSIVQEQLINSEKLASLGRLTANISHDLNTPIGIVNTSISQLKKDMETLKNRFESGRISKKFFENFLNSSVELIDITISNTKRMSDLVKNLKSVASKKGTNVKIEINLKEELETILKSLSPMIRKTPYTIELNCPDGIEIETYPGKLAQIITNLIDNSIKHGFKGIDKKGMIKINVEKLKNSVKIIYKDNGNGMDEETRVAIFEPFYTTDTLSGNSSGLGMSIVFNLVTKELKGKIKVNSEKGKGTEFIIELPNKV